MNYFKVIILFHGSVCLYRTFLLQGICYTVAIAAVNRAGEGKIEQITVYKLETGKI